MIGSHLLPEVDGSGGGAQVLESRVRVQWHVGGQKL